LRRFIESGLAEGKKCASDETEWAEDVKIGRKVHHLSFQKLHYYFLFDSIYEKVNVCKN
jgi:hypothetical protein